MTAAIATIAYATIFWLLWAFLLSDPLMKEVWKATIIPEKIMTIIFSSVGVSLGILAIISCLWGIVQMIKNIFAG